MSSVNKVILIGNLGKDPEIKVFPSGDQVANVTIATTDKWKDKQTGEAKEHTEWHRVMFAGKLAEIAGQWLKKGSLVYVEGSIRTRKWTDQSGQEKYSTEIRADQMKMLGKREADQQPTSYAPAPAQQQNGYSAAPQQRQRHATPQPQPASGFDDMDSDVPF